MIALVDYGLGNIQAFANIYRSIGIAVQAVKTAEELNRADKIILPGVGAFDWAMTRLNESGMREALDEQVLHNKKAVLGICVGMQMMTRRSDEGDLPGLGWIDAEVLRFDAALLKDRTHLPHMGWNDVQPTPENALFRGLESPRYYFLHSYYVAPSNESDVIATADYGITFAAAVQSANVFGTQFHPEKSHRWGIGLLKNFAEI
ncbi:imidazole glycerol phosphate synthase subunit HisH [Geothrix sp. PMB-07]|uniref:imidazole glycerol phosphate synthase subunit HisH n=1 Tax=Geothrix sp. PMB-07 TaxID=3068640 RepID=UPI002740BA33|nr:imidazole glycerol phosphate synthase subunit HisH [Geothrix sp. PMB-07]WLT31319.1 imidazole glycerol phosphate synthase subunit HisH [Geothrix sp. PMB-07]